MPKYRIELEVELELLSEQELKQHAREMEIAVDELDIDPPSAEFLEQQIIYALTGEDAGELLFAGSDVFFGVKNLIGIRSELLENHDAE